MENHQFYWDCAPRNALALTGTHSWGSWQGLAKNGWWAAWKHTWICCVLLIMSRLSGSISQPSLFQITQNSSDSSTISADFLIHTPVCHILYQKPWGRQLIYWWPFFLIWKWRYWSQWDYYTKRLKPKRSLDRLPHFLEIHFVSLAFFVYIYIMLQ